MNKNTTFKHLFLASVLLATVVGCAGDGVVISPSPAGTWVQNPADSHNTTLTISSNGFVTGRSENFTLGGTDILTGSIMADSSFNGKVQNDQNPSYGFTVHGTIKLEGGANNLHVMYTGTVNSAPVNVDIYMNRTGVGP